MCFTVPGQFCLLCCGGTHVGRSVTYSGCHSLGGELNAKPGTEGTFRPSLLSELNAHVQRWMTTAWTSLWTEARGPMATPDSVLPPWPAMLVSRPAPPPRAGSDLSALPLARTSSASSALCC